MAARLVSVLIDSDPLLLVERAAERAGLSVTQWLSATARREALIEGVGPDSDDDEAAALADDADLARIEAAETDLRAAGS